MPKLFEWTEQRLEKLREMWAEREPAPEIGAAVGCCSTTVIKKSRELGLERRRYVVKHFKPNLSPADARAAQQRFIEQDSRTPGERAMGDPPLERSALMQGSSACAPEQQIVSLGRMKRDSLGRANVGAMVNHLRRVRRATKEARP